MNDGIAGGRSRWLLALYKQMKPHGSMISYCMYIPILSSILLSLILVLESVVTPQSAFVKRGSTVSFECLSYTNFGNLTVSYEWSYPPQLSGDVMVEDEVLVVSNVGTESEVNFTCIAKLEGTSVVSMSSSTIVIGKETDVCMIVRLCHTLDGIRWSSAIATSRNCSNSVNFCLCKYIMYVNYSFPFNHR